MNSRIKGLGRQTARLLAFLVAVTCGGALAQTNVGPSQSFRYLSESGTNVVLAAGATFVNSTSSLGTIEGATDDAYEATISILNDPTADVTISVPSLNSGVLLISTLTTNDVGVANSVWGASNGIVFEGATANDFELTLAPSDVGQDATMGIPDVGEAGGSLVISTLDTGANDVGDANAIWHGSNSIVFEGATGAADAFELTLAPLDDPTADVTVSVPALNSGALMLSTLTTNNVNVANSIWGVSNGLAFGGATGADGFETTLSTADAAADQTIALPDNTANADGADTATSVFTSTLGSGANDIGDANAVWAGSNSIIFEGSTGAADTNETVLTVVDPTGERTITLPNATTTVAGLAVAQTFTENQTIDASDSLIVTTADLLTVGGVIVPQAVEVTFNVLPVAEQIDQIVFVATRAYEVIATRYVHAGNEDAGTVNIQLERLQGTEAVGSGDALLTNNTNAGYSCTGTDNTVETGALVGTSAVQLAAGDRLALNYTGDAPGELTGVAITVTLKRI